MVSHPTWIWVELVVEFLAEEEGDAVCQQFAGVGNLVEVEIRPVAVAETVQVAAETVRAAAETVQAAAETVQVAAETVLAAAETVALVRTVEVVLIRIKYFKLSSSIVSILLYLRPWPEP